MLNLLVFDPETGVILNEGQVHPSVAFSADQLPPGNAYVDAFPEGPMDEWRYTGKEFVRFFAEAEEKTEAVNAIEPKENGIVPAGGEGA